MINFSVHESQTLMKERYDSVGGDERTQADEMSCGSTWWYIEWFFFMQVECSSLTLSQHTPLSWLASTHRANTWFRDKKCYMSWHGLDPMDMFYPLYNAGIYRISPLYANHPLSNRNNALMTNLSMQVGTITECKDHSGWTEGGTSDEGKAFRCPSCSTIPRIKHDPHRDPMPSRKSLPSEVSWGHHRQEMESGECGLQTAPCIENEKQDILTMYHAGEPHTKSTERKGQILMRIFSHKMPTKEPTSSMVHQMTDELFIPWISTHKLILINQVQQRLHFMRFSARTYQEKLC